MFLANVLNPGTPIPIPRSSSESVEFEILVGSLVQKLHIQVGKKRDDEEPNKLLKNYFLKNLKTKIYMFSSHKEREGMLRTTQEQLSLASEEKEPDIVEQGSRGSQQH